jgi:thioredoxin 2
VSGPVHIVCPHCAAVNRVPAGKPAREGRCGRCREGLFTGKPVELTTATFEGHLTGSHIPLVVDFWAPWCAPCLAMAPAFAEAAASLEPKARLAKVNTEKEQALGGRFAIRGIPTVIIFRRGEEAARQSGAMDLAALRAWISPYLD